MMRGKSPLPEYNNIYFNETIFIPLGLAFSRGGYKKNGILTNFDHNGNLYALINPMTLI